jgi:threonine dehydratase
MQEKKTWDDSKFSKKIRIKEEHLQWIKSHKQKGGVAVTLESIIDYYIKNEDTG